MDAAASARKARLTGILMMCGAVACFACLDCMAKYLGRYMDVLEVVWARYTSAFLLALVLSNPLSRPDLMRTSRPLMQVSRSAVLLLSTVFNFAAFLYLQLDQALAILFSTPFMVAALAGPILGERVGPRRWAAIAVGFIGVLVVTQPGIGIHWAALFSLGSAVCYAIYSIMTRILARTDSSETTLFYSNMVGAIAMMPVIPFVWTPPQDWVIGTLMVVMGGFGALGHYLLIMAHRLAPATVLSPFMYTQLVWATIAGYVIFHDVPNAWTVTGASILIASGLYLLHRERVRNPQ